MKNIKKLTILHSNDLHGDFFAEKNDNQWVGGISRLSGYINKVRQKEKNVIYAIAGDMFRGSVIDTEYKGISTIEMINLLSPDVVTIGNHEVDYGIAHLLFIEKCANFPIINANLYIKTNHTRLFKPYQIVEIDGMKILFIGIITEEVLAQTKQDALIGAFIDTAAAAREVGRICNAYKSVDIDFTVILSHIGIEEDKKLAQMLLPEWGVDVIIGGHSHTFMDQPVKENGVLIAHAGTGTDRIGRFDIDINTDTNSIDSYQWQMVPINAKTAPRDAELDEVVERYRTETDKKYKRIITRFKKALHHPQRNKETSLGDMFADIFKDSLGIDVMLLGSGSIRTPDLGPIVDYRGLVEAFPYDDGIYMLKITGSQLKEMLRYMLRDEAFEGHTEFYQLSRGMKVVYSPSRHEFDECSYEGKPLDDSMQLTIGLQNFHFANVENFFNVKYKDLEKLQKPRIISTSCLDIIEEYLSTHKLAAEDPQPRIIIVA
jgi:5'-nucleotidase